MAKVRIIPKLLLKKSSYNPNRMVLVTTIGFEKVIEIGDPVSQAKIYEAQAADELLFLDLEARTDNRETLLNVVRTAAGEIFMPFTVGGGVKSINDFRVLLNNGADKVSINTAALEDPSLISEAATIFGSQCVVLSIDYRQEKDGSYSVWSHGGKIKTTWDPLVWAIEGEKRGAGEILLTAIDRDGRKQGLDIAFSSIVADSITVPLIMSGGCGMAQHFVDGFKAGRANGIAAGSYFCFKDENPMQTRSRVKNAGIPIRTIT